MASEEAKVIKAENDSTDDLDYWPDDWEEE